MKRWHRLAGLAFMAVGVMVMDQSIRVLRVMAWGMPGPGFMPLGLGALMLALAAALVATNWGPDADPQPFWASGTWARPLLAVVLLFGFVAAQRWLGFVVGSGSLVAAWLWGEERKPLWVGLVAGAIAAGAIYLIFSFALRVPLPRGALFGV